MDLNLETGILLSLPKDLTFKLVDVTIAQAIQQKLNSMNTLTAGCMRSRVFDLLWGKSGFLVYCICNPEIWHRNVFSEQHYLCRV